MRQKAVQRFVDTIVWCTDLDTCLASVKPRFYVVYMKRYIVFLTTTIGMAVLLMAIADFACLSQGAGAFECRSTVHPNPYRVLGRRLGVVQCCEVRMGNGNIIAGLSIAGHFEPKIRHVHPEAEVGLSDALLDSKVERLNGFMHCLMSCSNSVRNKEYTPT